MTYTQHPAEQSHRVCGERAYLYPQLVPVALAFAPGTSAIPHDVERHVRCTLEDHANGDHHALVMDLDGPDTGSVWTHWTQGRFPEALVMDLDGPDTGSVWTHWTQGRFPEALVVLPDCDATEADTQEPCCEYDGHPGAHTWQLHDPWRTAIHRPPGRRMATGR